MPAILERKYLNIAVLTVSDTRNADNDTSGNYLAESVVAEGHALAEKAIVKDDVYQLRAIVSRWIADPAVHAVLVTGGTGFSGSDTTPEALTPLFDKQVEGFGETFRAVSFAEIGSSTLQSRAIAGMANGTAIFCMPGSTGACRTAWQHIIREQLDSTFGPCNFVSVLLGRYAH